MNELLKVCPDGEFPYGCLLAREHVDVVIAGANGQHFVGTTVGAYNPDVCGIQHPEVVLIEGDQVPAVPGIQEGEVDVFGQRREINVLVQQHDGWPRG